MRIKCKCRALHSRSAVSRVRRDSQIIFNVGARKSTLQLFFFFFFSPPFLSPFLSLLKVGRTCIQSEPVGRLMVRAAPAVQSPAAAPRGNHAVLMPEHFTAAFWFSFQRAVIPVMADGFCRAHVDTNKRIRSPFCPPARVCTDVNVSI